MAEDIDHASFPVGPVGKPTRGRARHQWMVFKHTKYPNAAKEYLRFMMEQEQYAPWQQARIGYWCHPLKAYDARPGLDPGPESDAPTGTSCERGLPQSYKGRPSQAAAAAKADFVVLQMFASVCSGPGDAAAGRQGGAAAGRALLQESVRTA